MARKITDEEKKQILELLSEGKTPLETAKSVGRTKQSVLNVGKAAGFDFATSRTRKAAEAFKDYAQAERLQLANEGFDRLRDILPDIQDAREMQAWAVAFGTLTDKRRLEDGEATSRSEAVDPERRRKVKQHLDELAARRGA